MSDSGGVSKQFDPRFSPAFQPGYDPRVHREEPPRGSLRDDAGVAGRDQFSRVAPSHRDSARDATAQDGVTQGGAVHDPGFLLPESPTNPDGIVPSTSVDTESELETPAWWRRINPWIIALWVLGIVFMVIGCGAIFAAVEWQRTGGYGAVEGFYLSILIQYAFYGAPMLIVLGLATITSSIVVFALRWKR